KPTGPWISQRSDDDLLSDRRVATIHAGSRWTRSVDLPVRTRIHREPGSVRHAHYRHVPRSGGAGSFRLAAWFSRHGFSREPAAAILRRTDLEGASGSG